MFRLLRRMAASLIPALIAACSGSQSVLDPRGPHAGLVEAMWWPMLLVGALVTVLVLALLLVAIRRSSGDRPERPLHARQSWRLVFAGGVILPVVVSIPFIAASFSIANIVDSEPPENALTIEVVGRLWWWEAHYQDDDGNRIATVANEMHIPVGQPVRFLLTSDDVIHSFWVPNLQGKTDMIPGLVNETWAEADEPGVYRGQCTEYCGVQHALMAFLVIAEPQQQFESWLAQQQRDAIEPRDPVSARGKKVFLGSQCVHCHTVRGTAARGTLGPDLTHVGSRRTLAAATVPNTRGHMGGWIADPQRIKPGNQMPPTRLPPDDFTALITYLESLQ